MLADNVQQHTATRDSNWTCSPCNFIHLFHTADIDLVIHVQAFHIPSITLHGISEIATEIMDGIIHQWYSADGSSLWEECVPQWHQSGHLQSCPLSAECQRCDTCTPARGNVSLLESQPQLHVREKNCVQATNNQRISLQMSKAVVTEFLLKHEIGTKMHWCSVHLQYPLTHFLI